MLRKIFLIILLLLAAICSSLAASSYTISSAIFGTAGGSLSSVNYQGLGGAGEGLIGNLLGTNYLGTVGGIAVLWANISAAEFPTIANVKVDGKSIAEGDYIKASGTLTATITDETAININLSSIEVDGTFTPFAALTGTSTYDAQAGALTYVFSGLSDGNHVFGLYAVNSSGNLTSWRYTLKVDSGTLKAQEVLVYPNPYNPKSGQPAKIAYRLNRDSNISLYIFDALGQLVYKQDYLSGSEGAHIGYNEVDWSGTSNSGNPVANDLYFLRIVSDGKVIGKCKIAVLK